MQYTSTVKEVIFAVPKYVVILREGVRSCQYTNTLYSLVKGVCSCGAIAAPCSTAHVRICWEYSVPASKDVPRHFYVVVVYGRCMGKSRQANDTHMWLTVNMHSTA